MIERGIKGRSGIASGGLKNRLGGIRSHMINAINIIKKVIFASVLHWQ